MVNNMTQYIDKSAVVADNQAKIMIYMRDLKNYKPETEFVPDEEPF